MSDWHGETSWYRNESGELMCNTCKQEVFGGICGCYVEPTPPEQELDEILEYLFDIGAAQARDEWTGTLAEPRERVLNIINQEKAKLVDRLEQAIFEGTSDEGAMGYGEITNRIDDFRTQLNRIKQELKQC